MRLIDALFALQKLKSAAFSTNDAALVLKISNESASKILSRLSDAKQVMHLARNLWIFPDLTDALSLVEPLVQPFPYYISLQTALYYHEMISQIPSTIYAVSLARTKKYQTFLATISVHHLHPSFFLGFTTDERSGIHMATPEKALLDILYLSPAKSKLFSALPEIQLPENFNVLKAENMIEHIQSTRRRSLVRKRFHDCLQRSFKA